MKFKQLREKYSSKFPPALIAAAVKIALDMGGNMTGAYKKIERMKRGLGDDPVVKDALRLANESVQNEETINELNFSYAFFDKLSLNKFMLKALKIKGLTVIDSEKQTGGHFTVRVKADDKKIIAKANSIALKAMSEWVTESINENYNQDLKLATKNVARLSNKESGQDKKDYQAVSRALAQGNLGAVKKVIKGISTKEIQSDLLGILVGYNDLIAKLYPKAVDSKGNLKRGLTVDKMIKEEIVSEGKRIQDIVRKHKRELQKVQRSGNLELSRKAEDELSNWASSNGEIRGDDEDEFIEWLDNNLDDLIKGKIK